MTFAGHVGRLVGDFAGVLPRAHASLRAAPGWNPATPNGIRQLGEVALDELVLSGMTLMGPGPGTALPVATCAAVAQELSALGIAGAHRDPEPLRVRSIRRRRWGPLDYERLTFDHDPLLPLPLDDHGGAVTAVVHLCRYDEKQRPWLVWVHGAGQGQPLDLIFSRARRLQRELGFNVALPIQPGHGPRRKTWPAYPGMDPVANVAGMMRAVSEARAVVRWLRPQATAVAVAGVSMGSPVAALVSHLEPVDAVALYTPIFGMNAMIGQHIGRWGAAAKDTGDLLQSTPSAAVESVVDPLVAEPSPPPHRRLIVGAWHDRMALRAPAIALNERWRGQLYWHDGSHVGQLFSPQVQEVSERFLAAIGEGGGRRNPA